MAINREDYNDVKGAMGKAIAKKVSDATRDKTRSKVFTPLSYKNYKEQQDKKYQKTQERIASYVGKKHKIRYKRSAKNKVLPSNTSSD